MMNEPIEGVVRPVYKRVKRTVAHCPNCGEELIGNNSYARPWACSCGEWHGIMNSDMKHSGYEIRPVETHD